MSETCPTCGGPCTSRIVDISDELNPSITGKGKKYESLVKGEVVAEGWAVVVGTKNGEATEFWVYTGPQPLDGYPDSFPVLVIQKEEPMTGGQA